MLIDWVSLTFKDIKKIDEIFFLLGMEKNNFEFSESGIFGYTRNYRYEHINLYYNPDRIEMGFHLIMSGQGCREYEAFMFEREFEWSDFFDWVTTFGAHFTRLDVAIDCFENELNLAQVLSATRKGACVSRIKYMSEYRRVKLSDGSVYGRTLYFGSRSSEVMIRMYDKRQERIDRNYYVPFDSWVRCELEMKSDSANKFAEIIANGNDLGMCIKGVLGNSLRFVQGTKESIAIARENNNQSKLPLVKWWEEFLDGVQPLKISKKATETSIEKSTDWFIATASKQMAKLDFLMGQSYLDRIKKVGKEKLTDQELDQLAYRKIHDKHLRKILNLKI